MVGELFHQRLSHRGETEIWYAYAAIVTLFVRFKIYPETLDTLQNFAACRWKRSATFTSTIYITLA